MDLFKNFLQPKTVIALLFSVACLCDLRSQPANDNCETATDILNVESDDDFVCVEGSNLNALPESINNSCEIGNFPTVWFRIPTDGVATLMNIQITSNNISAPTITLFQWVNSCADLQLVPLTQSNLQCIVGSNGEAEAVGTDVGAGEVYYLAVSSLNSIGGDFEVCVNTISVASICVVDRNIEITSRSLNGPLEGPFFPGETIGICMNINSFSAADNGCQWFQGIVPVFGNGWDPSSFDTDGQPFNTTINGNPMGQANNGIYLTSTWDWFTDVGYHHNNTFYQVGDLDSNGTVEMCNILYDPDCPDLGGITGGCCPPCWDNAGEILPPGWFAYGINGSCGTPGPPIRLDWGDGNTCGCCMGPWNFCFELTIRDYPDCLEDTSTMDLTLGFFTFADGETGSWTGGISECALDQPTKITFPICCSVINESSETLSAICSAGIIEFIIDEPGVEYWNWTVDPGSITGANEGEGAAGSIVIDTLINPGSEIETVEYTFLGFAGGACPVFQKDITVIVNPEIEATLEPIELCGSPATYTITPSVNGGSGNYEYMWAPGGETTPSITILNPMNGDEFSVTVSDESGCIGIDSTTVTITSSLSVDVIAPITEQCLQDGPLTLMGTANGGIAPYLFEWTLPDGSVVLGDSINTTQSGLFILESTDTEGCVGMDSVSLTFNNEPEVSIESESGIFAFCVGDSIILTGNVMGGESPYSFTWTTPQGPMTGDSIVVAEGGVYALVVEDNNGCISDTATEIISSVSLPVVDLGPDTITVDGLTTLDAGPGWDFYIWSNGVTSQSTTINATGLYSVCVGDANGCVGCDTIYVDVITDVIQLNGSEYIRIYPNPNKGDFTLDVQLSSFAEMRITVINAVGKVIYSKKEEITSPNSLLDIDLKNPPEGMYFIQIDWGGEKYVGKVVVVEK